MKRKLKKQLTVEQKEFALLQAKINDIYEALYIATNLSSRFPNLFEASSDLSIANIAVDSYRRKLWKFKP